MPNAKPRKPKDNLKIGFMNAQSALLKALAIREYITSNDLDILYIAESWFNKSGDDIPMGNLKPEGYEFDHVPRSAKNRGGGIVVVHKKHIKIKKEKTPKVTTMEIMETIYHKHRFYTNNLYHYI